MDRRILALVVVIASALGIGTMYLFAPDTGPDPVVQRPVAPLPERPVVPSAPRIAPGPRAVPRPAPAPRAAPAPAISAAPRARDEPPHDLAQTYAPTVQGLVSAGLARRDRLEACFDALQLPTGPLQGRVPLTLVLADGGSAGGKLGAVAATDDPALARCLTEAVSDATFPSPGDQAISTVIPIFLPPG